MPVLSAGSFLDPARTTTRAEALDVREWVVKSQNAEQRAAAVRKIGVERVCAELGARVVDRQGEYELLMLYIGDERRRPYLKMRNPSVGIYHIEGVPVGTATVEAALHARKPPRLREMPVRADGAAWYQQGDVCIWPTSARAIQPRPTMLT